MLSIAGRTSSRRPNLSEYLRGPRAVGPEAASPDPGGDRPRCRCETRQPGRVGCCRGGKGSDATTWRTVVGGGGRRDAGSDPGWGRRAAEEDWWQRIRGMKVPAQREVVPATSSEEAAELVASADQKTPRMRLLW
ncbi:unnamed protein product [Lampetra planeri]